MNSKSFFILFCRQCPHCDQNWKSFLHHHQTSNSPLRPILHPLQLLLSAHCPILHDFSHCDCDAFYSLRRERKSSSSSVVPDAAVAVVVAGPVASSSSSSLAVSSVVVAGTVASSSVAISSVVVAGTVTSSSVAVVVAPSSSSSSSAEAGQKTSCVVLFLSRRPADKGYCALCLSPRSVPSSLKRVKWWKIPNKRGHDLAEEEWFESADILDKDRKQFKSDLEVETKTLKKQKSTHLSASKLNAFQLLCFDFSKETNLVEWFQQQFLQILNTIHFEGGTIQRSAGSSSLQECFDEGFVPTASFSTSSPLKTLICVLHQDTFNPFVPIQSDQMFFFNLSRSWILPSSSQPTSRKPSVLTVFFYCSQNKCACSDCQFPSGPVFLNSFSPHCLCLFCCSAKQFCPDRLPRILEFLP